MNSFSKAVLDLLYPGKCSLCDLLSEDSICSVCFGSFREKDLETQTSSKGSLDYSASLYLYEGRVAQAVKRLKYSRSTALARSMARLLAKGYDDLGLYQADVIIPVPIHWTRRSARGFNQSELLSEALPKEKLAPWLLTRTRPTRPQAGLTREQRVSNLTGAFKASAEVTGMSVLLVDDVLTSGHTASECAAALQSAGAATVGVLTFAGE